MDQAQEIVVKNIHQSVESEKPFKGSLEIVRNTKGYGFTVQARADTTMGAVELAAEMAIKIRELTNAMVKEEEEEEG